jgi:hypothetical protein
MKPSKSLIASAVIVLLPLAAAANDPAKTPAPMGTKASAQFDALDINRDGRISRAEASSDSKIEFASLDKNGDGFLDSMEFSQRDMTHESATDSIPPAPPPESTAPGTPADQPSTSRPDVQTPPK